MSLRAELIAKGALKPTPQPAKVQVFANPAALLSRRRDAVTKTDKALAILRNASRRNCAQAQAR